MKRILKLFAILIIASTQLFAQTNESNWSGYKRENFKVDGRNAWVTFPKNPAPGNPWVWRARFPGFHDEIDRDLLNRGFFTAHVNTENMFGSPEAMKVWDVFYKKVVKDYNLNPKVCLYAVSRGGLFAYNFANLYPERVAVIYGDTPVMDFNIWPRIKSAGDWESLKKHYAFKSDDEASKWKDIPVNFAEKLAKFNIPIFHTIGPEDKIVPPESNTLKFMERFQKAGGRMVLHKNAGPYSLEGHHFPLDKVKETCDFIEKNYALPNVKENFVKEIKSLNSFNKFAKEKNGVVRFLGGSITENPGWQNMTMEYLQQRFPECEFDFKNVGIGSHDSMIHAFRWREHFGKTPDLVFFEAAVNDLHNSRTADEQQKAYEGVIRGIKSVNPNTDIICLHFAEPRFTQDYNNGKKHEIIKKHEEIAKYYNCPSIDLAYETAKRMQEKQFTWQNDFRDLHPSHFGQLLYYQRIMKELDSCKPRKNRKQKLPKAMDKKCWQNGAFLPLENAKNLKDFELIKSWNPTASGEKRVGYFNCPMLVAEKSGAEFEVKFKGAAFGLTIISNQQSGDIEWSIDGKEWKSKDVRRWHLHLPMPYMLESELPNTEHIIKIRVKANGDKQALVIKSLLINK